MNDILEEILAKLDTKQYHYIKLLEISNYNHRHNKGVVDGLQIAIDILNNELKRIE